MASIVLWVMRAAWPMVAYTVGAMLLISLPRLVVQTPMGHFNDHQAYLWLPFFGILVASCWERLSTMGGACRCATREHPQFDDDCPVQHGHGHEHVAVAGCSPGVWVSRR